MKLLGTHSLKASWGTITSVLVTWESSSQDPRKNDEPPLRKRDRHCHKDREEQRHQQHNPFCPGSGKKGLIDDRKKASETN